MIWVADDAYLNLLRVKEQVPTEFKFNNFISNPVGNGVALD